MNKILYWLVCLIVFSIPVLAQTPQDDINLEVFDAKSGNVSYVKIDKSLHKIPGKKPSAKTTPSPLINNGYIPRISEKYPWSSYKIRLQTIIGEPDFEQQVSNRFPYSATVFLERRIDSDYISVCSGAMVGEYTVLTAAHCVLKNAGLRNDGTVVNPHEISAYVGGHRSRIEAKGINIFIPEKARKTRNIFTAMANDYAIILLDKPLGRQKGYFGVEESSVAVGDRIVVLGFPDPREYTTYNPHQSVGKVLEVKKNFIYHDADALHGSSGGPTLKEENLENIIGVVVEEKNKYNVSCRPADNTLISFVAKYRQETPYASPEWLHQYKEKQQSEIINKIKYPNQTATPLPGVPDRIRQAMRNNH